MDWEFLFPLCDLLVDGELGYVVVDWIDKNILDPTDENLNEYSLSDQTSDP